MTACSSKSPSSPSSPAATPTSTPIPTLMIYQNGFFYDWAYTVACTTAFNPANNSVANYSATDPISGDGTVLDIYSLNLPPSYVCGIYNSSQLINASAYYPNGHLQFDAEMIGSVVTTCSIVGTAASQAVTTSFLGSLVNGTWVHISLPISSIFPPATISTKPVAPFDLIVTASAPETILFDNIKWTGN